jgi:glycosyltransferase involved in cell wall biosynthesis
MLMLDKVRRMASEFDVMHFHIDQFHFPIFHEYAGRTITTLHGRQDLPDLKRLYEGFPEMPLVSISQAQREPIREANFAATIYHGLPLNLLAPTLEPQGNYLAFLGRISPEKGVDRAIMLARTKGFPLKIAAKVDRVDEAYFRAEIEPLLNYPGIEYVGEIDDRHKSRFLGQAHALLFPINWPEPFGLAMIEAMACGTPVLALRNGAVAEVVDEDVTGCIVDSIGEAIPALDRVLALDRGLVRQRFEKRFSVTRMTEEYVSIYKQLLEKPNTQTIGRGTSGVTAKPNGAVKTAH